MVEKRLFQCPAHDHRSVIFQHHHPLLAKAGEKTRPLVLVHGDAFELVIGEARDDRGGVEIYRLQSTLHRRHRHRRRGMCVDDRVNVGQFPMEQAVLGEAGLVHRIG